MATIDRSKYRKSSSEEMAKVSEEMKEREVSSSRSSFLKVEPGINVFRIFPASMKAESSLFCYPKVSTFLPFMEDEVDDKGNKTGKQVLKKRAIFNAKVHGNLDRDIVEEYIQAVKDKYAATIKDKKELLNKIKPLTDWKTGIKYNTTWIVQAIKIVGTKKTYGRLQLTDGVKKQMDALCLRQGESGSPIVIDMFSDPDDGKPIQWTSDPNNEDAKSKNKINILFEKDCPLTDEELEWLEQQDTLESLYKNSYTRKDFERQLKGLQLYDKMNKLNVFESPSFQSIIEACQEEVEEKIPEEVEEENEEKEEKKASTKGKSAKKVEKTEEVDEIPTILQEMDKKTLSSLAETLELDIELKATTPPSKMRTMIKDAIISQYELEGDDSEIQDAIVDIIENAFEGKESESEGENEGEGESEGEGEVETSEEENEGSSLLNKYRRKK